MARTIADHLHLDKSTVSRRLSVAADGGYLRNLEDKRGKPGRWVIGAPLPETVDLLPATADTTPDLGGCTVAAEAGGKNGDTPAPTGFVPPSGPGRCRDCGWHVPTQGHKPDCAQQTSQHHATRID